MSMNESDWIARAQTAEARLKTLEQSSKAAIERVRLFKENFGVREASDGTIVIDYDVFIERLGRNAWLELRIIGDEKWRIRDRGKPVITVEAVTVP